MSKKVLVATVKPFAKAAVKKIEKIISEQGHEFILLEKYEHLPELLKAVKDIDALIVRSDKIGSEALDAAKNLEIVVRAGAGYDNIDLKSATEHGVIVMNTPGQNSNAVAELALGMMVYIARNCFNGKSGTELKGKKLGMHAYGNVGKCVAKIARGYGMELFAFDPYIDKEVIEKDGVKCLESVEELYKTCQYISLHIPVNDKTRRSIDYKLLSKMPAGATLVNTARKEIICEESLMKIFEERDNFKYVSDVAPDCKDKIEASYKERYFFTPKKIGAQTAEANINAGVAAITQIVNFFKDGDMTFKVN